MTKHWATEVRGHGVGQYETECAGCTYLRKYGLPELFIEEDHIREVPCSNCGHPVVMHNTSPDDTQCTSDVSLGHGMNVRCQCDAQAAGGLV